VTDREIRSVAVVGGGPVALGAAIAFARALPRAAVQIVETPADPAAIADRLPSTLPSALEFHGRIGVDELDLVRRGAATHRLGTRFEHWSAEGESWSHVFGDYGLPVGPVGFHDLWLRAFRAGKALPYDRYAAAASIAEAGRFVHPEEDPQSPLGTFLYALRLDVPHYRERLAELANGARVISQPGAIAEVSRREDGGIAALRLSGGRAVEADLFLDCAGPAAPLLSALDDSFEDWGEWLPADRLLLGEAPSLAGPDTLDRAVATSAGWRWEIGLEGRRAFGLAFASATTDEARARRHVKLEQGDAPGELVPIRQGRRPRPWIANVLALGDAAIAVDPLHGTNLSTAHAAIERALELLPGRDFSPVEVAEYNRRSAAAAVRLRDFLALHYLRSGRTGGDFWRGLGDRPLPESLARTVEQFTARGRFPFFEEEVFDKRAWIAAMIGLGLRPAHCHPMTGAVAEADAERGMQDLAGRLEKLTAQLPPYSTYLARMREG
jgi:tryptophan halogenase